jgi:hypothetical protein
LRRRKRRRRRRRKKEAIQGIKHLGPLKSERKKENQRLRE